MRDVLQPQSRPAIRQLAKLYIQPTDPTSVLPSNVKRSGWIACGDGAAGIALQLVTSTGPQIAGNGHEPARDPVGIGNRIPDIIDGRIVGTRRHEHTRRTALVITGVEFARNRANIA